MKITLLTVGRTDIGWVKEGIGIYSSRLKHYIPFTITEIPELKRTSALSRDQIREREGELILKSIGSADYVVLLDEKGREYTSVEWASLIGNRLSSTGRNIVFVIGGAYGFSERVYERSDSLVSLSKMTFSHQMVRVIFAEQLYRAFTILRGEPYHHE